MDMMMADVLPRNIVDWLNGWMNYDRGVYVCGFARIKFLNK